jgi:hypothetical protein
MIDWTLPIETTETPPRPVRVLFDSAGEVYGVDIETNLWGICSDKVSVCRRDDNGMGTHFITLRNVTPPKPEPEFHDSLEWDELVAERDSLKAEVERLNKANLRLLGDIGQMRPVVDAAVAWEAWYKRYFSTNITVVTGLLEAVRAYQSMPKETASEAVANVAAMMGPVENCGTCHNNDGLTCHLSSEFHCQDWEMKK